MATPLDLPLPEITVDDFHRAWTRFELVAKAKDWNDARQKLVLPTLLRGKLVDYYTEADEETRDDLGRLKSLLMTKAGLVRDSLASSQIFMTRTQYPEEKVSDFAMELKRLFKDAYSSDDYTSAILLQRFLTGLLSPIRRQLLLHGKPETLQQAIKDAVNVEYALNFDTGLEETQDVNVVQRKHPIQDSSVAHKLQESLDQIVKRLETLEAVQKQPPVEAPRQYTRSRRDQPNRDRPRQRRQQHYDFELRCWLCGELGHLKRNCPLNYSGPTRPVGGWPRY